MWLQPVDGRSHYVILHEAKMKFMRKISKSTNIDA